MKKKNQEKLIERLTKKFWEIEGGECSHGVKYEDVGMYSYEEMARIAVEKVLKAVKKEKNYERFH